MKKKEPCSGEILDASCASVERTRYVKDLFRKSAPRYDLMNRLMSLGRDRSWRKRTVEKASFPAGSRILDLGIGTGDMAAQLAEHIPGCRITGVDNCPELMELGVYKTRLAGVRWVAGDGRNLPFTDGSFDGAVAAFSIRNMPDLPRVFAELHRILVPGGKLAVLDMVRTEQFLPRAVCFIYFGQIIPLLGRLFGSDPEAYSYLYHSIERFTSLSGLRKALETSGFREVFSEGRMLKLIAIWIGVKEPQGGATPSHTADGSMAIT